MKKFFPFFAISAILLFNGCSSDDSNAISADSETIHSAPVSSEAKASSSSDNAAPVSSNTVPKSSSATDQSSATAAPSSSNSAPTSSSATAKSSATETSSAATTSSASTPSSDWHDYCLEVINNYRATESLKSLILAPNEKQECTTKEAADDLAANAPHGHFGDCDEFAQNSGPNINLSWYKTEKEIVDTYLKMMWDEKKLIESGERNPENKDDYSAIGHYLNMSNTKYSSVACGISKSADGKTAWFNVNFY